MSGSRDHYDPEDDFGTFDDKKEEAQKPCLSSASHDFKEIAYTTFFFKECKNLWVCTFL